MAKKIHLAFLQYVLDHQNAANNYFNRFFILQARLKNEQGYPEKNTEKARCHLTNAGLISESNSPGLLYITSEGKQFLHQENRIHLMHWLEVFTQFFNAKCKALGTIAALAIAALTLYFAAHTQTGSRLIQSVVINIKQTISG
jgi:hypothetical protein